MSFAVPYGPSTEELTQGAPMYDFPSGLSKPALRALANAGYTGLDQLSAVSEAELKRMHGMGPKAIGQLRSAMAEHGLAFAGDGR
ncbi:MAG: hypothetical protein ACRDP6_14315 [Actinoallomurus sp.]